MVEERIIIEDNRRESTEEEKEVEEDHLQKDPLEDEDVVLSCVEEMKEDDKLKYAISFCSDKVISTVEAEPNIVIFCLVTILCQCLYTSQFDISSPHHDRFRDRKLIDLFFCLYIYIFVCICCPLTLGKRTKEEARSALCGVQRCMVQRIGHWNGVSKNDWKHFRRGYGEGWSM